MIDIPVNLSYSTQDLPAAFNPADFSVGAKKTSDVGTPLWTALRVLHGLNSVGDFLTTQTAFQDYPEGFTEMNPLAKGIVGNPWTHAPWAVATTAIVDKGMNDLFKKNKTLGYLGMGTLNALRLYVLLNNLKQLQKAKEYYGR